MKNTPKKEDGFSLTEILIALVVLGFAAIAILNGLSTDSGIRGQNEGKVSQYQKLINASEIITSKTFINCSGGSIVTDNPYGPIEGIVDNRDLVSNQSQKGLLVQYLASDGAWKMCNQPTPGYTDVIQKITIKVWNSKNIEQKREILKTFGGSVDNGGSNDPIDPLVISASRDNLKVAASSKSSCGNSDYFIVDNSADISNLVFVVNLTGISSNIASYEMADSQKIRVIGISTGQTSIEIQAVDPRNGSLSNKISIPVEVIDSFDFSIPDRQIFVVGKPRNPGINLYQYLVTGTTNKANLAFKFENPTDGNSYSLVNGVFNTLNGTGIRTSEFVQLRITDSRLPQTQSDANCAPSSAQSDWRVKLNINSQLKFSISNGVSGCQLSVISSLPCMVSVNFNSNTGSGSLLNGVAPTNGIATIFNFTNNSFPYSGSISISNNSACLRIQSSSSGLIKYASIDVSGNLEFLLETTNTNLLVDEKIRIEHASQANLRQNSAAITSISPKRFTLSGSGVTYSSTGSRSGFLITTDFKPTIASISNGEQGKFTLYPLTLPSFKPILQDSNFGNPYNSISENEIIPISCIDN